MITNIKEILFIIFLGVFLFFANLWDKILLILDRLGKEDRCMNNQFILETEQILSEIEKSKRFSYPDNLEKITKDFLKILEEYGQLDIIAKHDIMNIIRNNTTKTYSDIKTSEEFSKVLELFYEPLFDRLSELDKPSKDRYVYTTRKEDIEWFIYFIRVYSEYINNITECETHILATEYNAINKILYNPELEYIALSTFYLTDDSVECELINCIRYFAQQNILSYFRIH